jgi:predicted nuclease of predicted toxin-antitoxin system
MKIKLDENLPVQVGPILHGMGHDVHTAMQEDLSGCLDAELWRATQREGRFFITQDLDFSDVRLFTPGEHHGILIIRLHSPSRSNLIQRITELFRTEEVNTWTHCFVVASERKVRVRRPHR